VTLTAPSTLAVPVSTEPVRVVSSLTATISSPSVKPSVTGVTLNVIVLGAGSNVPALSCTLKVNDA
jgi:hypothetical protein